MDRWFYLVLAAAALGALWVYARSRKAIASLVRVGSGSPSFGICLWKTENLPEGWPDAIGYLDFITVKICDGSSAWTSGDRGAQIAVLKSAASNVGTPLQGWGWHYLTSVDKAKAEAAAAAEAVAFYGVKVYWVNAEEVWSKGPNPIGHMEAFVGEFRRLSPNTTLVYLSAARHAPALLPLFDVYAPMVYATLPETVAKEWKARYAEAQAAGKPFAPVPGSGRHYKGSQYWGYFSGPEGMAALQQSYPAQWIAPYIGNAAGGEMLTQGNAVNPSLIEASAALKGAVV